MIKMTMDHQPNVEISTKCSEAEVTVPGLASGEAVIIVAAADLAKEEALEVVEVMEATEEAGLEATVEEGLVATSTTEAGEASIVEVLEAKEEDLEGVAVVDLETEDMGGVAIKIALNVYCVYVTVL